MKNSILAFLVILLFGAAVADAQIKNPVKWLYSTTKIADKIYEIHITAMVDGNWHIYSQDAGEGPEPTVFTFTPNPLLTLDGKVKEIGKLESSYDPNFKSILKYYQTKVDFVQRVKIRAKVATLVKGSVSFMVCNDRECLPPKEVPFSISIDGK